MELRIKLLCIVVLTALGRPVGASEWQCAPDEAIEAYEEGLELLYLGDTDAGVARLEQAVALFPDFDEAHEALTEHYLQSYWEHKRAGRYAEAIEALEKLNRGAADPSVEAMIGYLRKELATPQAAREALERSALHERGSAEAIAACKDAIRIYPDYLDAHVSLVEHYMHAGDEASTKRSFAELVRLDPHGAAPAVLGVVAKFRPEWLTQEYGRELEELFSPYVGAEDETDPAPVEIPRLTEQEIATTLELYKAQIAAIRQLIDRHSDMVAAGRKYRESKEIREELLSLGFISIFAERGGPGDPPWWDFTFFDDSPASTDLLQDPRRSCSRLLKAADGLDVPTTTPTHWGVSWCEVPVYKKYCKPRCATILEFTVRAEIEGAEYTFLVKIRSLDPASELGECTAPYR